MSTHLRECQPLDEMSFEELVAELGDQLEDPGYGPPSAREFDTVAKIVHRLARIFLGKQREPTA
jgi:hypothetical protein